MMKKKKQELPPHNMIIGERKKFKTMRDLVDFINTHKVKNGEFASGFNPDDMKKECWIKKME